MSEKPGEGIDTVNTWGHYTLAANLENLVLLGSADLQGRGNDIANTLTGNSGINLLDGGAGADLMQGGAGGDTYFVDNAGDVVAESASEGFDAVFSTVDRTLEANVETLVLQGSADLQGDGNSLPNTLYGNAGNNLLDGNGGADAMVGGAGNDTYFVDDANDAVFESAGAGNDTVFAAVHYWLSANVETLVLQGGADLQGYGNSDANTLHGNVGNNLLNGNGGADLTQGGAGDDLYFVDNAGDAVAEKPAKATTLCSPTVDRTLEANVETLVLQGSADLQGYGNGLANTLFGNAGNNILDGKGGADIMLGGAGNDSLFRRRRQRHCVRECRRGIGHGLCERPFWAVGQRRDPGAARQRRSEGYGNADANTLFGNGGNNLLNGGTGADTMAGGAGNYEIVDDPGDVAVEDPGEGADAVFASVDYTLAANVETLCYRAPATSTAPAGAGQQHLRQYRRQHARRWRRSRPSHRQRRQRYLRVQCGGGDRRYRHRLLRQRHCGRGFAAVRRLWRRRGVHPE